MVFGGKRSILKNQRGYEMKSLLDFIILEIIVSKPVYADFEKVTISPQTEKAVNGACIDSDKEVQLHGGIVSIKKFRGRISAKFR